MQKSNLKIVLGITIIAITVLLGTSLHRNYVAGQDYIYTEGYEEGYNERLSLITNQINGMGADLLTAIKQPVIVSIDNFEESYNYVIIDLDKYLTEHENR